MIRILVISDTHRQTTFIEREIARIGEDNIHAIIHAGDCVCDAENLSYIYTSIPVHYVSGNNDFSSKTSTEELVTIGGVKIFITHGHGYRVKYDDDFRTLKAHAKHLGADIVVFGHTHIAHLSYDGNLIVLNPGTAGYAQNYAFIEIEEGKPPRACLMGGF